MRLNKKYMYWRHLFETYLVPCGIFSNFNGKTCGGGAEFASPLTNCRSPCLCVINFVKKYSKRTFFNVKMFLNVP